MLARDERGREHPPDPPQYLSKQYLSAQLAALRSAIGLDLVRFRGDPDMPGPLAPGRLRRF
jgi:hypothetical protein